jgi:transcriptional regulator with XRE-family HTH domain
MFLGKLIRLYRRKHDVSLLALAEELEISYSMLQRLEDSKNTHPPSPELLEKISSVIKIPYVELLESLGYLSASMKSELPSAAKSVPVIAADQFYKVAENPNHDPKKKEVVYASAPHVSKLLAVRIQETTWSPFILLNDILIIEQNLNAQSGDRMVLLNHKTKSFVIKQCYFLEQTMLLADYPLGTTLEKQSLDASFALYGKIIEQHRYH